MQAKVLILLLFLSVSVKAQTFSPAPAPLLSQELGYELANECFIYFDNPSGDTLQLRWRNLELSKPDAWVIDLCDYGHCYFGVPANSNMNPIFGSTQAYLKLIVQPGLVPGDAWLWFRVFERTNEQNFVDVYFSLYTPGVVPVFEPESSGVEVYPNPASQVLHIQNNQSSAETMRLMDTSGRTVAQIQIGPGGQVDIPVQDYLPGIYFLKTSRGIQKILIEG